MQKQVFWQKLRPIGDPRWSSLFLKDFSPQRGPTVEQFMKDGTLWEELHTEAGENV